MRRAPLGFLATLALTLLTACSAAGIPRHDGQEKLRDRYASYAGPPIESFTWLGQIR